MKESLRGLICILDTVLKKDCVIDDIEHAMRQIKLAKREFIPSRKKTKADPRICVKCNKVTGMYCKESDKEPLQYDRWNGRKEKECLTDNYLIGVLTSKKKLSRKEIPQELIRLEREYLKIRRELRGDTPCRP